MVYLGYYFFNCEALVYLSNSSMIFLCTSFIVLPVSLLSFEIDVQRFSVFLIQVCLEVVQKKWEGFTCLVTSGKREERGKVEKEK